MLAPLLLVLFSWSVLLTSDAPGVLLSIMVACGLLCAVVLHGYTAMHQRLVTRKRRDDVSER